MPPVHELRVEEYRALKSELAEHASSIRSVERETILSVGALFAWFIGTNAPYLANSWVRSICLMPSLIVLLNALRAYASFRRLLRINEYLGRREQELLDRAAETDRIALPRWESQLWQERSQHPASRLIRLYGYSFWVGLLLASTAGGLILFFSAPLQPVLEGK
jgi:hypothetical protein